MNQLINEIMSLLKKLFTLALLICSSLLASAQTNINIVIEYAEKALLGMPEKDFREYIEATDLLQITNDDNWDAVKKGWYSVFCKEANSELAEKNYLVGAIPSAPITARVVIKNINQTGNIDAVIYLTDSEIGDAVEEIPLKVYGGTIGDIVNLMGDGFEQLGETFGKTYIKILKQQKKQQKKNK